jgi:hypothetical protein
MWEPEGISKRCGKGGEPASWLPAFHTLSFHSLLLADDVEHWLHIELNDPQPIERLP